MFNCSCCGTDLTLPYFFNGGVYGWTCIKKVNPNARKNKPKTKCVEVDVLRMYFNTDVPHLGQAVIQFNSGKITRINFLKKVVNDGEFAKEVNDQNFSFYNGKWWLCF